MPEAAFDQNLNLPSSNTTFVKLKSKGDKIKFRIAANPHYETVHFIDKHPVLCTKYNTEDKKAKCVHCDKYALLVEAGKEKETEARDIKPVTNFYYPILNLADDTAGIFQFTAKSIHYTIAGYAKEGLDVFGSDWVVERTEEKGSYYKVLRLDGSKLSAEQKEMLLKANGFKMKALNTSSSVVIEREADESLNDQEPS
jgi:hypothetical protein